MDVGVERRFQLLVRRKKTKKAAEIRALRSVKSCIVNECVRNRITRTSTFKRQNLRMFGTWRSRVEGRNPNLQEQ